jgi:hypothetical protein
MRTNFNMDEQNITMVKGDTLSFNIVIDGLDDQDLESAFFTCKDVPTSNSSIFQKSLGDGISKIDDGKYLVTVSPDDTEDDTAGAYYYDCQIGIKGDVFTILIGLLTILQDVTN